MRHAVLIYQSEQVGYVVAAVGGFAFDEVGFQAVLALKIPAEYARFGQIRRVEVGIQRMDALAQGGCGVAFAADYYVFICNVTAGATVA